MDPVGGHSTFGRTTPDLGGGMPSFNDRLYYSSRTLQEIAQGDRSTDATVAAIHYELAHRYALLAAGQSVARLTFRVIEGGKATLAA